MISEQEELQGGTSDQGETRLSRLRDGDAQGPPSRFTARFFAFVGLTFVISWPIWYASGVLVKPDEFSFDSGWLLAQIGVLAPGLAALIISAFDGPRMWRNNWRILGIQVLPLFLPGLMLASARPGAIRDLDTLSAMTTLIVAGVVIAFFSPLNSRLLLPGTGDSPGLPGAATLALSTLLFPLLFLVAWGVVNWSAGSMSLLAGPGGLGNFGSTLVLAFAFNLILGGSLGEEVGWRGFLLPLLLRRFNPLTASIVLGLVWALWHTPADLAAGFGVQGPLAIVARIIWTIPITVIFTWLYLKSNGSLLVALLLHTSLNVLGDLGFSRYESSLSLMVLLNMALAVAIALTGSFRRGSADRE